MVVAVRSAWETSAPTISIAQWRNQFETGLDERRTESTHLSDVIRGKRVLPRNPWKQIGSRFAWFLQSPSSARSFMSKLRSEHGVSSGTSIQILQVEQSHSNLSSSLWYMITYTGSSFTHEKLLVDSWQRVSARLCRTADALPPETSFRVTPDEVQNSICTWHASTWRCHVYSCIKCKQRSLPWTGV